MGSDSRGSGDGEGSADDFLREVARAPALEPPKTSPPRVSHFRVGDRIGRGGMGIVYRAVDESLGRTVALKVLPPALEADEARRKRLLREARSAAAVSHPNIATIYEVGEADGRIYIAMELAPGKSLRDRLADGALPIRDALEIAAQIAGGLACAHEAGIVHRDLKPENVVVSAEGRVKILDFGLAKLVAGDGVATPSELGNLDTVTQDHLVAGTPAYMAPEQARGMAVTPAADVFAFGITLHEMVTGERPLPTSARATVASPAGRTRASDAPPPYAELPPALAELLDRCLKVTPDERIRDGAALVRALAGLVANPPSWPSSRKPLFGSARLDGGVDPDAETPSEPSLESPTLESPSRAPPPSPASRRRRMWPGITVFAGVLAAVVAASVLSSRKPVQLTAAPVQAPAKPTATFVTDLPVPPTTSAEAAAEYSAGLQAFRDSSTFRSELHFRRAAELDPTMAAALLRAALFARAFGASVPYDYFVRAASLRSRLTPRDQELADALEPLLLRTRPDKPEAVRRLSAVVAKRAGDVELLDWLAVFSDGDPEVQLAIVDRAIALDANDAHAENTRGLALLNLGRNAEARSAFERSTLLASTATAGFRNLSELDAAEGRCDASLKNAGFASNRNPVPTTEDLAAAVAVGHDDETLHEAITQQFSLLNDPRIRRVNELRVLAQIALVRGNFDAARRMANERLALVAQNGDLAAGFSFHYFSTEQLVRVAQETGDDAEARRLARSFVARAPAWSAGLPHSLPDTERLSWLQRLAAGDDSAQLAAFEDARAATTEERLADRAELPMRIWLYEYASAVQSRRDAEKALDLLPRLSPSALPSRGSWMADARMGLTYAIADRPKDALPYLRRAVASCTIFHEPYLHMQATLRLGQALEATGDVAGACDAYGRVVSRWGRAVPRSVTAERARERARRLGCGR